MEKKLCCIPPEWIELELLGIRSYNHDTSIFSFGLPSGQLYLNLPTCACLLLLAPNVEHDNKGDAVRPYTPISPENLEGKFELLIKRYDEWGEKCEPGSSIYSYFSYNHTAHAYKPKGAVSNYLFNLSIGHKVKFKHIPINIKIQYPFINIKTITMIAVGVGIAPMIQALHALFNHNPTTTNNNNNNNNNNNSNNSTEVEEGDEEEDTTQIRLLYGVRKVSDILLREQLEEWADKYKHRFQIVYGVGTRWGKVHFGAKTSDEYVPPALPEGFIELQQQLKRYTHTKTADDDEHHNDHNDSSSNNNNDNSNNNNSSSNGHNTSDHNNDHNNDNSSSNDNDTCNTNSDRHHASIHAELGWIDEDKIFRHAFSPAPDTKIFICGLPGVYLKLCGPRTTSLVTPGSALFNLGYTDDMVVKF